MTADEALALCCGASDLIRHHPASVAHRRGAAFVARQAIEGTTRAALGPYDTRRMRWRSRFLLLATLAGRDEARRHLARRGYLLWSAWSEVCHYRPYDLVPSAPVLLYRLDETTAWIHTTATAARSDGL